jgi:hypothetical protein
LLRFVLFLGWVSLVFQRPFFLLATGLRFFLSLSAAAVFSAELFLVLCLWSCHHHHRSQVFAIQQVVLECVLDFQLLLSSELQVLLFVLDLWC